MTLSAEKIQNLVVHHSATTRDKTTFQAIKKYHIGLGWGDIGYHYLITGDGIIWPGRAENVVGAHCISDGMNFKSLGICLTGNFMVEQLSEEQKVSLSRLLKNLMVRYGLKKENVFAHGNVAGAATLCPGTNLKKWLDEWRLDN